MEQLEATLRMEVDPSSEVQTLAKTLAELMASRSALTAILGEKVAIWRNRPDANTVPGTSNRCDYEKGTDCHGPDERDS
tara:strand:- start:568 stop:804 length:237 start_codon:yes stop_codon:yes gene_type:complete